uniref:Uncharacterized protein n=1 Tax=Anguilla anguilla TaxID=7936 RepID=A0A0E9W8A8_ANGAN
MVSYTLSFVLILNNVAGRYNWRLTIIITVFSIYNSDAQSLFCKYLLDPVDPLLTQILAKASGTRFTLGPASIANSLAQNINWES